MSFQTLAFLAFLAAACAVCLPVGRRYPAIGKVLLAVACGFFYLSGVTHPLAGFAVLLTGMAVTLAAARCMTAGRHGKAPFWGAVCWHAAVLLAFKYTGFFTGGAISVGWAPLGLSFFTFQQIWYLKEVFTGQYVPEKTGFSGLADFFLYTFFFPSVTSGPILRPNAFFPQMAGERLFRPDWQDAAAGLYAICVGTVKKVLLADSLAVVVDNGWAYEGNLSAVTAWMLILGYTLQLYFDFSGYCDIAFGAARLLGLHLPVNFDSPYRSLSVTEFWKRWHITLTTFLRECVYFPLGGSRRGAGRTYLHILLVFLISGFWHGAGWTFILWGLLHGLAQVAERLLGSRITERIPKLLRWGVTFLFVNVAWVFFRAPDVGAALDLLQMAVTPDLSLPADWLVEGLFTKETEAVARLLPALEPYCNTVIMALLYGGGMLTVLWPCCAVREMEEGTPGFFRSAVLAVLTAVAVASFTGVGTFIYSNF